jgi:glycerol uptake facilitator protein
MLIGFSLGGTTGFAINPARDLGPRIAHFLLPIKGKGDSDWKYAYVPILGPIVGSFLGASTYRILYHNEFEIKYLIIIITVAFILFFAIKKGINSVKTK